MKVAFVRALQMTRFSCYVNRVDINVVVWWGVNKILLSATCSH